MVLLRGLKKGAAPPPKKTKNYPEDFNPKSHTKDEGMTVIAGFHYCLLDSGSNPNLS